MTTSNLYDEHTFREPTLGDMHPGYPVVVTQENTDGTYQGHYDLDKMTITQKIAVM